MFRRSPNASESGRPEDEANKGERLSRATDSHEMDSGPGTSGKGKKMIDKAKVSTGAGAALLIAAICWGPTPSLFGASAPAPGCGPVQTAVVDLCLSLDLGFASAVLRAAL